MAHRIGSSRRVGFRFIGAGVIALSGCNGVLKVVDDASGGSGGTGGRGGAVQVGGTAGGGADSALAGADAAGGDDGVAVVEAGAPSVGGSPGFTDAGAGGTGPAVADCGCASSETLKFFGCAPGNAGVPQVSGDGRAVAFTLCSDSGCTPSYVSAEAGEIEIPLPTPRPGGGASVEGMSEDGNLVLLTPHARSASFKAFLYRASDGKSTALGLQAWPLLMSADGVAFGVTTPALGKVALARVVEGELETLGELPAPPDRVYLEGATPDGSLVVGYIHYDESREPFRWSEAGGLVLGLPDLPTQEEHLDAEDAAGGAPSAPPPAEIDGASFFSVSRDGSTIAGYLYRGPIAKKAFIWTEASGVREVGAADRNGGLSLLSDDGSVLVATLDDGENAIGAFRLAGSGAPLALVPSLENDAWVMTPDASLVLGQARGHHEPTALYVWTAEAGARDIGQILGESGVDLSQVTLFAPRNLSRDGKVAVGIAACGDANVAYRLELPE